MEHLGQGGGGITWRAFSPLTQKMVCLKELRWSSLANLEDERRFEREGAILTHLNHPAIPHFYEFFTEGKGRTLAHYISLELIEGQNLDVERKSRGYTTRELLESCIEIAQVLDYLHQRSPALVHRDLKPSNIMRRTNGQLVLIDFGAARLDNAYSQVSVAGTFGYMAPEQIRGESTPASDIYALGMTIAVLASGKNPEALLTRGNRPDFSRLSALPQPFQHLLSQMCHEAPEHRPTAAQVIAACRNLLKPSSVQSLAVAPKTDIAPKKGFWQKYATVSLVMQLCGLVGGGAIFLMGDESMLSSSPPTHLADPVLVEAPKEILPELSPGEACANGNEAECTRLLKTANYPAEHRKQLPNTSFAPLPADWPQPLVTACEKSFAPQCRNAGVVYQKGDGVTKSPITAREFFHKACGLQDIEGCSALGSMLIRGEGGPKDLEGGRKALTFSCDSDPQHRSCYDLAMTHEKDNPPLARDIFMAQCANKKTFACSRLSYLLARESKLLPTNPGEKREMLIKMCGFKICQACDMGSSLLRKAKDLEGAKAIDRQGCDQSCSNSCERLGN